MVCKYIDEQMVTVQSLADEAESEEACGSCGAEANKLVPIFPTTAPGKHVSWSKWSV